MRVVAGALGGRRLETPPGASTRPTTDKVRQAVFNALDSAALLDGARYVDLFAGSGAMGIEALSRGAASCTFVERDRVAAAVIRSNVDTLGLATVASVVLADAERWVLNMAEADVVVADPPYEFSRWTDLMAGLAAPVLVAESDAAIDPPSGWEVVRVRRYGRTAVTILRRIA
jgi:16S rRNA (guanine966-N2)-methyltransferase